MRWVLAKPGTHTRRTLRAPDGVCMCGEDTGDMVSIACAACRQLDWSDCDRCGAGCPTGSKVWTNYEGHPVCQECADEFCPDCGMDGYCRCQHADTLYDRWREEGW